MRTDEQVVSQLDSTGLTKTLWGGRANEQWMRSGGGEISLSISGYERNRLFLSARGRQFHDISGVSGLDGLEDGRAFALADYDHDGWQDIVVVNINAPFLNLYRNDIRQSSGQANAAGVIAIRFVGGNHSPQPSASQGPRDGYGALVTVSAGGKTLLREHRCGEGLAAQNSATMLIGIGESSAAETVVVRWPNGKVQQIDDMKAGTLATVFENPRHSPDGAGYVVEPYVQTRSVPRVDPRPALSAKETRLPLASDRDDRAGRGTTAQPRLRMYTSTATWCAACKASLPQLRSLRDSFAFADLDMSAVPIDPTDGPKKLEAYVAKYQPAYRLLADLTTEEVADFAETLVEATGIDVLPSTLVTDSDGRLLMAVSGVPTVSQLRKLLRNERTVSAELGG